MRLIVAGTRTITDSSMVYTRLDELKLILEAELGLKVTEVVGGTCDGPDKLGVWWARAKGIPVMEFPADWKEYGRSAGPMRNQAMANYGNILCAFWDGRSTGTKDMIRKAKKRGLIIFVYSQDGHHLAADYGPKLELDLDKGV